MNLQQLKPLARFRQPIFDKLLDKCERETKFGRVANLLLYGAYQFVVVLKRWRATGQRLRHSVTDPVVARFPRLFERPPVVHPVMAWDKPLSLPASRGYVAERVTIIAEMSIPQCRRYRVEQKLVALRALGYEAEAVSFTDLKGCLQLLAASRCVIFYRTPYWPPVKRMLDECHRLGIPAVFDIDDLVFDVDEYAKHPVLKRLPTVEATGLLKGAKAYRDCLAACDHAFASTATLAEWMAKACRGRAMLVENALDALSFAAAAATPPRNASDGTVTIGYGSGTKSHDADFELVAAALARLMDERPEVRLALHGYLEIPDILRRHAARIHQIPFLAAPQYLQAVARFDINLAPLEANVFNDAKSNIKYLEASILGVPTVASDAAAFRQVVREGHNGFLARSEADWYGHLLRLVDAPALRREVGERARAEALAEWGPERTRAQLQRALATVLPPRPAPSSRPRLLLVNCLFRPFSFGGATLVVEHLAAHLRDHWDVAVCTANTLPDQPAGGLLRFDTDGTHVFSLRLPDHRPERQPDDIEYSDPLMAAAFGRVLDAFRPDVVHFHAIQGLGADIIAEAARRGVKSAVTHHDAWWLCERQFLVMPNKQSCFQNVIDLKLCAACTKRPDFTYRRYRYLGEALERCDLHLAPSRFHSEFVAGNLRHGRVVHCNKNGVLLPDGAVAPRQVDPANVRLAYLGGGDAVHKGYFLLKSVMESLPETNYTLTMTDVHQKIGAIGIDPAEWRLRGRVRVVQPFDQHAMDAFYRDVDVLIFPSQCPESFGMTVREAMARNVWVIATRSGGITEDMIDGKNGDVVEIGDSEGLKRKIQDVLRHPERLSGYVTPGRLSIRGFAAQAAELDGLLRGLLGEALSAEAAGKR